MKSNPLTVACEIDHCKAAVGSPCIGTRGKPVLHFHWHRRQRARELLVAAKHQERKERPPRKKGHSMVDMFLVNTTGKDRVGWVAFIQDQIGKASFKVDGQVHDETRTEVWLSAVVKEIAHCVDKHPDVILQKTDSNILAARATALVMATWSARVIRAKAYDPRRPVDKRKEALKRLVQYQLMMTDIFADESLDHEHFPGQEWDPPHAPGAKDGGYV